MNKKHSILLDRATSLCNSGKYIEALPLYDELIANTPQEADLHRMKAQTLMMLGRLDEAVDCNIEALRLSPHQTYALILMGNIFIKKDEPQTAMQYYEEVVAFHPTDALALNNVAGALIQIGQYDKAIDYFEKAMAVDDTYPNTYYGLALAYYRKGLHNKSWDAIMSANEKSFDRKENPGVLDEMHKLELTLAKQLISHATCYALSEKVLKEVEEMDNKQVVIDEDRKMYLSARAESAFVHSRPYHKVIINPDKPYFEHLMMHELVHLRMHSLARKAGKQEVLSSDEEQFELFYRKYSAIFNKVAMMGDKEKAEQYARSMYKGLMLQLFNCPLDLLVEDYIFRNYPDMRPMQLLSLFEDTQTNINAVAEGVKNAKFIPVPVYRANKIMNITTALHLDELYGLNFINYFKPTKFEYETAKDLYEEYKAYRDDFQAGEEYDLCRYFMESLDCGTMASWGPEGGTQTFSKGEVDRLVADRHAEDEIDERNDDFRKNHPDGGNPTETMMMTMYMLGALQRFEKMSPEMVKKIAMEIAMVGLTGIAPDKKGYAIPSLHGEEFGGFQFLALYYVSVSQAMPELLPKLRLPFDEAYYNALRMYDDKK